MGAPYTLDLRERVVAAFRSGMSRLETATLFKVSESSVQRWSRLDREKGDVAARPMGGNRPFALASERDRILERIAQQPDLPLRALLAELDTVRIVVQFRTRPERPWHAGDVRRHQPFAEGAHHDQAAG